MDGDWFFPCQGGRHILPRNFESYEEGLFLRQLDKQLLAVIPPCFNPTIFSLSKYKFLSPNINFHPHQSIHLPP